MFKRKITLILIFFFICLTNNLNGADEEILEEETDNKKTNVFHGYQKTKWGSSIKTVKKKYANLTKERSYEKNITCYEQKKPNNIIKSRQFYFYKNKLFQVHIFLTPGLKKKTKDILWEKLGKKLGSSHRHTVRNSPVWIFNNGEMAVKANIWINIDTGGWSAGDLTSIFYFCVEIEEEREEDELEEEAKSIDDF